MHPLGVIILEVSEFCAGPRVGLLRLSMKGQRGDHSFFSQNRIIWEASLVESRTVGQ